MPRALTLLLASCTLVLAACGSDSVSSGAQAPPDGGTPTASAQRTAPQATGSGACTPKEEDTGGKKLGCPTPSLPASGDAVVTLATSEGSFAITLDAKRAPLTANSVAYLVRKRFFDGLDFHRVVPDFVIQGGDPVGNGTGGPGYQVVEAPPATQRYTRGVVAMAKGGTDAPGASGSQFFVVTAADVGLPAEYALVGRVTEGMGVVDRISALGEGDGPPRKKVTITKATLG